MTISAQHLPNETVSERAERTLTLAPVPAKRNLSVLSLLGRIILGGYFVMGGANHFLQLEMSSGYAASKGVPFPSLAVLFSGALLLAGGTMLLLGWKSQIGSWLIILFLVPVSLIMHDFWTVTDSEMRMQEMVNFTKNFGLVGAMLMIATIRRWPLSLEQRKTVVTLTRVK